MARITVAQLQSQLEALRHNAELLSVDNASLRAEIAALRAEIAALRAAPASLPTQEEIDASPHAGITTPGDYAPTPQPAPVKPVSDYRTALLAAKALAMKTGKVVRVGGAK